MDRQRRGWIVPVALAAALVAIVSTAPPAAAGGRVAFGFTFGVPFWGPYPYPYAYGYPYPYPYPAYSPPLVMQAPPVYVQPEQQATARRPQPAGQAIVLPAEVTPAPAERGYGHGV